MDNFFQTVLYDPFVGKIVAILIGVIVINLIVRFLQRLSSSRIKSKEMRYGIRSSLKFFGYLAAVLMIIGIFSDQLSNIMVALGVAGVGIASA